jgi:hypothetical protein
MRNFLFAILVALLAASSALAEHSTSGNLDKSPAAGKSHPWKGAGRGNPCALYDPGFIGVEGTETSGKIGGIGIGAGISSGSS